MKTVVFFHERNNNVKFSPYHGNKNSNKVNMVFK